ncbi:MAG: hypothetical protein K5745_03985 [Saccharofermentans sp.]|nr:hypothetical protein [Saccharofermentans sp.]
MLFKQKAAKITASALILSMLFAAASCANKDTPGVNNLIPASSEASLPTPTPEPGLPDKVIIADGDLTFLKINDIFLLENQPKYYMTLQYNYQPGDVAIAVEEWSSSDESVATISDKGKLEPVGVGECEISLHVTDGLTDGAYTSITVTVEDGVTTLENTSWPDYDTLLSIAKDYFSESDLDIYDASFYAIEDGLPFIACSNSADEDYDGDIQDAISDWGEEEFIYIENGDTAMILRNTSILVICDEYELYLYVNDTDYTIIELAEEFGFTLPEDQIDLSKIS